MSMTDTTSTTTPQDAASQAAAPALETITLAGGCFWCVEAAVLALDGVLEATSGYAQGQVDQPSYEQVCGGRTGHAEAVRVRFDPRRLSLQALLDLFFTIHDPTTPNRQGGDVGPQYRSGIYFEQPEHEAVVREYLRRLEQGGRYGGQPIVTELEALRVFWPAEAYHQRYFEQHPEQGYCQVVIAPKMAKVQREFAGRLAPKA
ncbi:peptide-methionine (S)-S-oxide reductase MsrA [Thiomonas sp. FB-6]|uniref:peptide-methionine (S)-S-oxide reductase MsrA n=1 Tax=Thiomonas sp. FB-6 TaxID=1158291 RepID=UPI0003714A9E